MIKILTYVNDLGEMSLEDLLADFETALSTPGAKVALIDGDLGDGPEDVLVLYTGHGTEEQLEEALAESLE